MSPTDWLYAFAALASALAAVLAWAAKLWWGREYSRAKDEIIRAKDQHIAVVERELATLRDLTPMKIREYFTSVRMQLEEYNDALKGDLEQARQAIAQKDGQIAALHAEGTQKSAELTRLQDDKAGLESVATQLEQQINGLRQRYESEDAVVFRMPKIDPKIFENVGASLASFRALGVGVDLSSLMKVPDTAALRKLAEFQAEFQKDIQGGANETPDSKRPADNASHPTKTPIH